MLKLSFKWSAEIEKIPESGMGYHVVDISLTDGRKFRRVTIINDSAIFHVQNYSNIPFKEEDILNIKDSQ